MNEGLGDVLTLAGRHEDARTAFASALIFAKTRELISRARLHRKIGFSHSLQRHFAETTREFDLADRELGEPVDKHLANWWEEKVWIQLERMHLFYWQGMVKEMRELADQFRPAIVERGAAWQRAQFLKMLALSMSVELRASGHRWNASNWRDAQSRRAKKTDLRKPSMLILFWG